MYGINIPSKELINRTAYNWFCYLKECELLSSDMIISKHMVLQMQLKINKIMNVIT